MRQVGYHLPVRPAAADERAHIEVGQDFILPPGFGPAFADGTKNAG